MYYTESEALQYIADNDVKFIKLLFTDILGGIKSISIMPEEMHRAFSDGIIFDAAAVKGFTGIECSDLVLRPDPATLSVLPWRPQQGRVIRFYCNIFYPDGMPFEGCCRRILREAVQAVQTAGYSCKLGIECEFYLFKRDESGAPTMTPVDTAGYCDLAPLDKGENVRREICLTLEEMGIKPETSRHEQGPGQNEIDFKYSSAMSAVDNVITFRTVVKTIADRNGLFASFMPKPLADKSGSGMHINISLYKDDRNIFDAGELPDDAKSFIAGILDHVCEMTSFLNPLENSYVRLGKQEAPNTISWSHTNRSALVRIPAAKGDLARFEIRSPDAACNPYLAAALLLYAGLDGVKRALPLPPPVDYNLFINNYTPTHDYKRLPATLDEALAVTRGSSFIRSHFPINTLTSFLHEKDVEGDPDFTYL